MRKSYRCSIIADPEGDSWDFARNVFKYLQQKEQDYLKQEKEQFVKRISPLLEQKFSEESSREKREFACIFYDCLRDNESVFELNELEVKIFRDKEIKPKIKKNIRRSNCFFIHDSNSDPMYWFTCLRLTNHALRNSSAHEIINVLPYHKFSRQDVKDESRVPISARDIADSLNHDHTRVLTMDVHNPAIQGFYGIPFDSLYSFPVVTRHLNKNCPEINPDRLVICTPDEGGVKRARALSKRMKARGIAIVDKYRLIPGEVGGSLGLLGDVEGMDVLITDDIIDSGSSAIQASKVAKEKGARNIYMYCTHGLFTEGYTKVLEHFDKFFVGNTIAQPNHERLEVIPFEKLFAEAIYTINIGDSLSRLFDN